jgi:hypothetical protein
MRDSAARGWTNESSMWSSLKCRHPHAAAIVAEQMLDARAHFFGRFVGECDGQNFFGLRVTVADEVRDAARDDAGLPRSGAGEDEKRPCYLQDRFALFRVEGV